MLQYGHVHHHGEKCKQREDDKILHYLGLGFFVLFVAFATKDERFVSIAEGLSDHCHNHGNFHASSIDAQLGIAFLGGNDVTVTNLVGHLVENARQTQKQQRPSITQHPFQQVFVETITQLFQFGDEAERDQTGADQVNKENIADLISVFIPAHQAGTTDFQLWCQQEDEQVHPDAHENEQQLQGGEFDGTVLVSKTGKKNGLEGI